MSGSTRDHPEQSENPEAIRQVPKQWQEESKTKPNRNKTKNDSYCKKK